MGTLTKVELEEEVRAALMNRTDLNTRLGRFLNMAQQRLARIHDFDEMQTISEGVLVYTGADSDRFLQMPTLREMYSFVLLDDTNSRKLVGRTSTWMDRMQPKPEYWSRDYPTDYCVWGNYVEVFPLPLRQFTVRMRWTAYPANLVDDDDVSQFTNKDDVLVELATAYALRSLGKEDDALKHEKQAMMLLGEAKESDRFHPDRNISAGASDAAMLGGSRSEPWNDPFVRETN